MTSVKVLNRPLLTTTAMLRPGGRPGNAQPTSLDHCCPHSVCVLCPVKSFVARRTPVAAHVCSRVASVHRSPSTVTAMGAKKALPTTVSVMLAV